MADTEYTPTTEEVRERFINGFPIDTWAVAREECGQDFDRWLAAHDREVAAKVLEDAAHGLGRDDASQSWEMWDTARKEYTTPVDWLRARADALGTPEQEGEGDVD